MLKSRETDSETDPRGSGQQTASKNNASSATGFDARNRLDGKYDDTTVRQAVEDSTADEEFPVVFE